MLPERGGEQAIADRKAYHDPRENAKFDDGFASEHRIGITANPIDWRAKRGVSGTLQRLHATADANRIEAVESGNRGWVGSIAKTTNTRIEIDVWKMDEVMLDSVREVIEGRLDGLTHSFLERGGGFHGKQDGFPTRTRLGDGSK